LKDAAATVGWQCQTLTKVKKSIAKWQF